MVLPDEGSLSLLMGGSAEAGSHRRGDTSATPRTRVAAGSQPHGGPLVIDFKRRFDIDPTD